MKDIVQNLDHLAEETAGKLEWLAEFGKDPEGGVSRLLYTKEWVEGQHALKEWMESEGLEARFDEIGNLFGTLKGHKHKRNNFDWLSCGYCDKWRPF